MQQLDSRSIEQAKKFLTRSLLGLLSRDQTARTINAILSAQIERLLEQYAAAAERRDWWLYHE